MGVLEGCGGSWRVVGVVVREYGELCRMRGGFEGTKFCPRIIGVNQSPKSYKEGDPRVP